MSDPNKKPLTADEIEALLRASREREPAQQSDIVSDEPLGPGDVQHLRNMPLQDSSAMSAWPYEVTSTDELLDRAELHLAAAMSSETNSFIPDSNSIPPYRLPPLHTDRGSKTVSGVPLAAIGDIELDVTLELGRAELMIEDLLALREGSVVTLDKAAGEPIDILANGKLIARGEVIVMDNHFCVRICEVLSPV